MIAALAALGRHGRLLLVAGLLAGLALPGTALALRPWLPEMVGFLLFLAAVRIGPAAALGSLRDLRRTLSIVLAFQLLMPLAALALVSAAGLAGTPAAVALVLVFAAPSVTGSPNFTILLGHAPGAAMRMLILGTALFPLTVLPVLWLMPGLGDVGDVAAAALRLLAVIAVAVAAGFALRHRVWPDLSPRGLGALDGLSALALAVVVIGLMSALGPALRLDPVRVAGWLALALGVNFGAQIACALSLGRSARDTAAISIVAGNRNIALFLVALPAAATDPLLLFIGCYQVPMYLTPLAMHRFYGRAAD